MWHHNRLVRHVYVVHVPQAAWAMIEGVAGWKRIRPGAADGVTNLVALLSAAKANNRRVHVWIDGNYILRAILLQRAFDCLLNFTPVDGVWTDRASQRLRFADSTGKLQPERRSLLYTVKRVEESPQLWPVILPSLSTIYQTGDLLCIQK